MRFSNLLRAALIVLSIGAAGCLFSNGDSDSNEKPQGWRAVGEATWNMAHAVAVLDDNLIVAGLPRRHTSVTRWDGENWHDLADLDGGSIHSMIAFQGSIVVGGGFSEIDGVTASHVAQWDGKKFAAMGGGVSHGIYDLLIHDGELFAFGPSNTDGEGASRWDGSAWAPLPGAPLSIWGVASYDGGIVAAARGGTHDTPGGRGLFHWAGTEWAAWPYGLPPTGGGWSRTSALCVHQDDLYISFERTSPGEVSRSEVHKWNGAIWETVGGRFTRESGNVSELLLLRSLGGTLYVSGDFAHVGDRAVQNIAAWDGMHWNSLGAGLNDFALDAALYQGDLVVAGPFWGDGAGNAISHVGRWTLR